VYIYLFLDKNNNKIKLKYDFNDIPMNESPPINGETAWDGENELHDSNYRIVKKFISAKVGQK